MGSENSGTGRVILQYRAFIHICVATLAVSCRLP